MNSRELTQVVDNTFVIQYTEHKENFLYHINNTDQAIKFRIEVAKPDGPMPFLDTSNTRTKQNSIHTFI